MSYYAKLLSSYIKTSGKTLKEISKELYEEKNLSIDSSYISKIKTGKKPPASEDVNRALAEVLYGNPNKLVFAGYIEKAPNDVQETFSEIDQMVDQILQSLVFNSTSPQLAVIIDHLRQFKIDGFRPFCIFDQINLSEIGMGSRSVLIDTIEIVLKEEFSQRDKLKVIPYILKFFRKLHEESISYGNQNLEKDRNEVDDLEYQNELLETAKKLNLSVLFLNGEREIVTSTEGEYLKTCLEALRTYNNSMYRSN
ncbi:hypothetical protein K0T92_06190 [Paenibacillus oenotherae]|uniref:HTH cro/C1-type domain-containing protein n=1 Tax=Paenibacillus oenotherae TaxID=1435645 RepID=A0ABS7D427_9BACL|nr:hypothetical protein [Paenibacillus oenotherae]MBW7474327.1 hypothetical protein [Paenibacillus oenotherae]